MGSIDDLLYFLFSNRHRRKHLICSFQLYKRVYDLLGWIILCEYKLSTFGKQRVKNNLNRSIFQSISVIGYCMIPLALIGFLNALLPSSPHGFVRLILVTFALLWSSISCIIVMKDLVSETKKFLCGYPIFLFYIFLSWYAIVAW